MKKVSIDELVEVANRYPNYTIDVTENRTNRNYYNIHDDIIDNMVEWNCGNLDYVLDCVVNFFNDGGYIDSYQLGGKTSDIEQLKLICDSWDR